MTAAAQPTGIAPEAIVRVLRSDRVIRRAALLGLCWLACFAVLTWRSQDAPGLAKFTANIAYLVPVIVVAVTGCRAAWRRRHANRIGRAWVLFACSGVLWLAGEVMWSYRAYTAPDDETYPSPADVFYILSGLLIPIGLLVAFRRAGAPRSRRMLLDVTLVALGLATLGWQVLVAPQVDDSDGFSRLITVAYPLTDIAILVCLVSLGLSGHDRLPTSVRLVGWAYLVWAVVDCGYTYQTINDSYGDTSWLNLGYQVGAIVLTLGGLVALRYPEKEAVPAVIGRDLTIVPLLVAALAAWAVVAAQIAAADIPFVPVVVAAVIVAGLLYRQLLVTRDRTRLARELRDALAEQARLAVTDPLTGLHNRRFLQDALDREVARARRSGAPLSLVVLDIDHFKRINDAYGHAAGDAALVQAAQRLGAVARAGDVIARHGGEEFAWLLPDTPEQGAAELAERLRAALAGAPVVLPETGPVEMSGSLGVATLRGTDDATALMRDADRALYRAKEHGRNRVVLAPAQRVPLSTAG
ncbi:GGDEF domain-containing protein [Cryptosporangium aurantiacum]|uniref:Diguanylate cyclase (GGDEF) domain-containing protein n=1 Tax=Cryptosporangium aurantiacum TaxID=134849 RepID=A0A1M7TUB6_9ACTN|nr:GGDEF domain-containing protein [Cryptosporangium aurantiacum]SHN74300.1 diguanylate cyclase (GGDEF) domain-containing protein [Cryptosporangium aurantiacum]